MPNTCCIRLCKGNYKTGPKVSSFAFPHDEELKRKWLKSINRANFTPTVNSRVCEEHFKEEDIERKTSCYVESTGELLEAPLKRPRLKKDAVPSIFPYNIQGTSTFTRREDPEAKKRRLEYSMLEKAIKESIALDEEYRMEKRVSNIEDLYIKVQNADLNEWIYTKRANKLYFIYFNTDYLNVKFSVCVCENLSVQILCGDTELHSVGGKKTENLKVNNIDDIKDILQNTSEFMIKKGMGECVKESINLIILILTSLMVKLPDHKMALEFFCDQIKFLGISNKHGYRFNCETILFCGLLCSISPHAYKFLRNYGILFLPSFSTIKRLCHKLPTDPRLEQQDSTFLHYVRSKFKLLKPADKIVVLMIDEIHLKPYIDYRGGNIVGNAYNNAERATSAHVFMINSMLSKYKEVVHILPVKTLHADSLFNFIKKVIIELENIGFEVLAVVSDNNAVNKKAMSYFKDPAEICNVYNHPKDKNRPLFFIIDPVHIIKNIRNNWLNKTLQQMIYPDFTEKNIFKIASFACLKQMHQTEKSQLLKYGYSLTLKALYPTPIERQNVKLVLQIFNSNIVSALRELGPKKNFEFYEETASYIERICTWWDIINVKTTLKGQRLKNEFMEPLTHESKHITDFLKEFLSWCVWWQKCNDGSGRASGNLTKETEHALIHTTDGLLKMAQYCINEKNFNFFLFGKVQTDKLEERFGKYRQQAGSQYHISVRQVFESESKLRLQCVMPLVLKSKEYGNINISIDNILSDFILDNEQEICMDENNIKNSLKDSCMLDENDIEDIEDNFWPILTYIAGYTSYSLIKKFKCDYCKTFITDDLGNIDASLISATSRGGLCYPHYDVVICTAYTYLTVLRLVENEHDFLSHNNQRQVATTLVFFTLSDLSLDIFLGFNCTKHLLQDIIKQIIHTISNILLNNYSKKQNDTLSTKTMPHLKRIKPNTS